jgi:ubiquinone/menaquinone biosynthesis C-methylase UbiE
MTSSPDDPLADVPSGIDLRVREDAAEWVATADRKRPWRASLRATFAELLRALDPPPRRLLELGGGPGLLAEAVLDACAVDEYVLLDFSPAMLEMARARLAARANVRFVLADFKQPGWTAALPSRFDAVLAMQSVHEIRHKRHVPELYRQLRTILRPGGLLIVCDHTPPDDSARMTALHATEAEQHSALSSAGFDQVKTVTVERGLYLCTATVPRAVDPSADPG